MERVTIWLEERDYGKEMLNAMDIVLTWFNKKNKNDLRIIEKITYVDLDQYTIDVTNKGYEILQTLQKLNILYILKEEN